MRASRWVPAAAAVLLVVGVLATRDGTAAQEADLLPPVAAGPSAPPSVAASDELPVLLEANGLAGLRLGTSGGLAGTWVDIPDVDGDGTAGPADLPGGCVPTQLYDEDGRQGWSTSGWVVDELVSAVLLTRWEPTSEVTEGLGTWLGPTLGSPVEAASELPGARTTLERPHGPGGPEVTVVHVALDGVEAVFSDAAYDMSSAARGGQAARRITTIEVRHPRARHCSQQAMAELGPAVWGADPAAPGADLTLGLDGLAAAPIGSSAVDLAGRLGLSSDGGQGPCEGFSATTRDGGWLRVVALDDVVVQASLHGPGPTSLGVAHGSTVEELRAAVPLLEERYPGALPPDVEVVLGDRVLGASAYPGEAWVPDVDVPVTGGPRLVQSLSVRDADAQPALLC